MKPITHTSDTGLGILSVLERANQEILKLRKAKLSYKSKYWKPVDKRSASEITKTGGSKYNLTEPNQTRGLYDEWTEGFKYFCEQTVNTKGQKVNRAKLKERFKPSFLFGKNNDKD
jgi:hypothetical protein